MSKNYGLLLKIKENLEKNPSYLRELPVKGIIDCIIYELHEIRQLYNLEHHESLKERMIYFASEMLDAQVVGDSERALEVFKRSLNSTA